MGVIWVSPHSACAAQRHSHPPPEKPRAAKTFASASGQTHSQMVILKAHFGVCCTQCSWFLASRKPDMLFQQDVTASIQASSIGKRVSLELVAVAHIVACISMPLILPRFSGTFVQDGTASSSSPLAAERVRLGAGRGGPRRARRAIGSTPLRQTRFNQGYF